MDTRSTDEAFLLRALELAARGPAVDPNPRVGCVVVADGSVVGEGWHDGAGTPHAEVMALSAAGDHARGGTAYVSLEPCAHVGRTGPCAEALVTAGVRRVVYSQPDPNPAAQGGAPLLLDAGVEVSGGLLLAEAEALNAHWTFAVVRERPYVTWKFAATLDGRSAAADGSSRWITGEQARSDVHRLRATAGALVVGTGTVLADDPALTVRTPTAPRRPPVRVIVGEREIPGTARVLDDAAPTVQLATHDPQLVLKQLHAQEIRHVWLEGGPSLAAAFLRSGVVDEVVAYLAPALLGDGAAAVAGLGIGSIDGIRRFELSDVTRLGDDLRLRLRPTTTEED